jgi:large subunit ribosomal protein L2
MGKRIISQARGKGSLTYQAKKRAYIFRIGYPKGEGESEIVDIIHSPAHSAPLLKLRTKEGVFYNPAFNHAYVGQKISIGGEVKPGNIIYLKNTEPGLSVYNLERNPGDGGKMIRAAGSSATVLKKLENGSIIVTMPNKKTVTLHENCRATVGIIAGDGRITKPFVKAGKKHYKMKAINKLWPRTSAIKVNAIDHPFGSGRGKRAKPKIAKRNAPAGRKVGHIRPRRTGWRK